MYVTVLVTTSLMCLTLLPFSHRLECAPPVPTAEVGGLASAYLFALRAASQSNGLLMLRALKGDRTGLSTAGLGGMRRLGKVAGPLAGAERGIVTKGEAGWPTEIGAGFEDLCTSSHVQLQSVESLLAVVGALSRSTSPALSVAESSDLHVTVLAVLPPVEVRFSGVFPIRGAVRGGLATEGDATLIVLRKSM